MNNPSKLLLTGCRGQLGRDLVRILSEQYDTIGVDIEDVDITDKQAVKALLSDIRPDWVIHPAAFTDVDACESQEELAMAVNAKGTRHIARACREVKARMLYYSTDYVFDGTSDRPYREDDPTNPATVYGKSKLVGEQAVLEALDDAAIIRIAWVYGRHDKNFVKTMLGLAKKGQPLKVVDDQFGNPTWTEEVVRQTEAIIGSGQSGIFHATSEGEVSWYKFACDIFEIAGLTVDVSPCTTAEFPRPAPRPRRSTLDHSRLEQLGLYRMRHYREALEEFLTRYTGELTP